MATRSKSWVGQSALVGLTALTLCASCISYRVSVDKQDRTVEGYAKATGLELGVGGLLGVMMASQVQSLGEAMALAATLTIVGDVVLALTLRD